MFGLFKAKNPYEQAAVAIYAQALRQATSPALYTDFDVPDTFDGRFDLLLVHIFVIVHVMAEQGAEGQAFNQALFDVAFSNMDQTLREMGIGDMGIPKHMRRMMKAFNGRMHSYTEALSKDNDMESALLRNLYGTVESPDLSKVRSMKAYIQNLIDDLKKYPVENIYEGKSVFK